MNIPMLQTHLCVVAAFYPLHYFIYLVCRALPTSFISITLSSKPFFLRAMSAKEQQLSGQKRERSEPSQLGAVSQADQAGEAKTEKKMRLADTNNSSANASASASNSSTGKKIVAAPVKKRIDSVPTATYKRINEYLKSVDIITIHDTKKPDYLCPAGDDLERSDCIDGKWNPPVTSKGLSLLEHFLCVSYPLKKNLNLLNETFADGKKISIVAEYGVYRAILEEAVQLLLHPESSLVSTLIGFVQWNNKSGEIQECDFPDYLFFFDVIAYGYDRLPIDLIKRILTSMVHQDTAECDLSEFGEALAVTFEDSLYDFCKDTSRWTIDDFKKNEERKNKMNLLYHQIATVISDEAEEMGVGDDAEGDEESEGDDEEAEGDESEGSESGSGEESEEDAEGDEAKPSKSKSTKSAKSTKSK